jgi:hypothetical protein
MKKRMLALVLMPMATLGLTNNEWTGAAGPRADGLFSWNAADNWKQGVPDATHNVIFKTVSGFDPAVIDVVCKAAANLFLCGTDIAVNF